MKIPGEKLASRLGRELAPLYVLSGDEPLLVDEALELIREQAAKQGAGEREVHVADRSFEWEDFGASLQNMSLFSSRRLVELRVPTGKPGEAGARYLASLAGRPDTGNVIIVLLPVLDYRTAKSKWATALAESAVWADLKQPAREQLPAWLRARLKKQQLHAGDEALDILAARVEGNLLAAKQEIDKLALLVGEGEVTAVAMRAAVADGARFDIFQLTHAALTRDCPRALRVLCGLKREGESPVLVAWSLVRDVITLADLAVRVGQGQDIERALYDMHVWRTRHDAFRLAVRGRRSGEIGRLVRGAARADQVVKGVKHGDPWKALTELTMDLSGARPMLAEIA